MINFTYNWKMSDLKAVKKNNLTVFSCFACGGGSTMGYKMSGFNVIGCNEIDPEMIDIYKKNHNPKYSYLESIETFKLRDDLPDELYNLDILDGSPPCSNFSMAGSREKAWGKKKKFREGQSEQILDDLFFHFIELAKKLQPKVIIAENVKGMIQGNAKGYVKKIISLFKAAGYDVQLFLLNGATMGLPQRRERVFFICKRRDLNFSKLKLCFNEKPITISAIIDDSDKKETITKEQKKWWKLTSPGKSFSSVHPKGNNFACYKLSRNKVAPTLTASQGNAGIYHDRYPRKLNLKEYILMSSFPSDYLFNNEKSGKYQIGMSVPPLMMHKISKEIAKQWFEFND